MAVRIGWIVAILLAALTLAALFTAWWMARDFHGALDAAEATVRAVPPVGNTRADLPPLLAAFVGRSGVRDAGTLRWVRMEQRGEMRLAADGAWMPLGAVQHSAVAQPGFTWRANVKMAGGVTAVVLDGLVREQGILEARLYGAIPVAKAGGPETLKGELMRYLAELPWNPAAIAANPAIRWRQEDARRVSATVTLSGVTARVNLRFDEVGDIMEVSALDRPMGAGSNAVPTPWHGAFSDYRLIGGLRVPTRAVVWWDLPSGRFEYWRGEVTAVSWK